MKDKIIDIIGFGIERERASLMADQILELFESNDYRYTGGCISSQLSNDKDMKVSDSNRVYITEAQREVLERYSFE